MVAMVPNTPRYFTVEPLPVAAEPLASPWICAMKVQAIRLQELALCLLHKNTLIPAVALWLCLGERWAGQRCRLQFLLPQTLQLPKVAHLQAWIQPFSTVFFKKHKRCVCEREHDKMFLQNLTEKKLHKRTAFRDKCFLFKTASLNLTNESYIPSGRQVLLILWICFTCLILASFTHYASNASSWCVP